jgi:hypothetical protein
VHKKWILNGHLLGEPQRISAFSSVNGPFFNVEATEVRRARRENNQVLDFLCKAVRSAELVCYSDGSMKKLSHVRCSPLLSTVLSAVVLCALCFSVGEGLRLTPFPGSIKHKPHERCSVGSRISASQYGPLNVPTQNQKRSKRQALDLSGPTAVGARYAAPELSAVLDSASTNPISVLSVTRPAGRAPPFPV